MNNYSNMNYFMPNNVQDEFTYLNNMHNVNQNKQMPAFQNTKGNLKINSKPELDKKFQRDPELMQKLSKQAGDNMMFNKSNYNQQLDTNNLYDVYNGFIRGNMFPELYNQYKIAKPFDIEPMNEQAEMLTYIDAYGFAAHELNLYLDVNPDDRMALELFKDYTTQKEHIVNDYEKKYGPLFVDSSTTYPWAWNDSPWPWEN